MTAAVAAEGPLDRARALSADRKPEAACAAYAEALSRADLSRDDRATARYQRALLLERELDRPGEALLEYRRYLDESRDVLPRTTRVVQAKVAELESYLGPDGELRRELERIERGDAALTRDDVSRLEELLYERRASHLAPHAWLALARLCQDPAIADWRRSMEALDRAEARGIPPEETEAWRYRGKIERRRERVFCAGVALASLLLCTTACLTPWRNARRADWLLMVRTAMPGLLLAAVWGGFYVAAVRQDPNDARSPLQGPLLLAMAAAVLLNSMMLGVALRGRRLARLAVPLSAMLLSLAGVAVFCWLFDCFPIFGL